jgi:hypothetical protein
MLPTGKNHISYSEIKTWLDCSWRHKLIHIEKLADDEPSIYSDFGKILHAECETFLKTGLIDKDAAKIKIREMWTERGYPDVKSWPVFKSAVPDVEYWVDSADSMLSSIKPFFDKNFERWEYVEAEHSLYEKIDGTDTMFKGFVDAIIKVKDKKGKYIYYILDWKTSSAQGWNKDKLRDFNVHLQLMLYKFFWSRKNNIDPKQIRLGFILLKRLDLDPKKRKPLKAALVPISLGPVTTAKTLTVIRKMINSLSKQFFIKNRTNCQFCQFYLTSHCKIS